LENNHNDRLQGNLRVTENLSYLITDWCLQMQSNFRHNLGAVYGLCRSVEAMDPARAITIISTHLNEDILCVNTSDTLLVSFQTNILGVVH